jgi:SAM-dependent methyltransferase
LESHYYQPAIALWRSLELEIWQGHDLPQPVLDVGCGNGYVASLVLPPEGQAVGLDMVFSELRVASRLDTYRGVVQCVGGDMPFDEGCFRTVFSNCVVEHIPDLDQVLESIGASLRPGGVFAFTTVSHRFLDMLGPIARLRATGRDAEAEAYAEKTNVRLGHYHYHTPTQWQQKLDFVGLDMQTARYFAPASFMAGWERLDVALTRRIWRGRRPIDLYRRLVIRGLAPRRLFVWFWYHRYRHLLEVPLLPQEEGGGLFIIARKPEQ